MNTILTVCIGIIAACLIVGLIAMVRTTDKLSRAVMADLVFYAMVALFLVRTLMFDTWVAYEIAILAAIAAGVIPTMSMARIISRGRR